MGDNQVAELPEGTHIATDGDGRYLWRGTIDLRDNPAMANLVTKIAVGIVGGFTVLFALLILLASPEPSQVPMMLGILFGIDLFILVVTLVSYRIYVAVIGGTYSAYYLMDETGVLFRPAPKEDHVAKGIAATTAAVSLLSGNFGLTAASIAAANTTSASVFKSVRKVRGIRSQRVIKVSHLLLHNQIYVAPEDYDFVYGFITNRCPKAKCTEE